MIRALLLDLDDTLYDEADYVRSGFRLVAREIAARLGVDGENIYRFMLEEVGRHGRGRVFDATLEAFGVPATPALIAEFVELYRHHRPAITLYPDAQQVLESLRGYYRLAIVTDGLPVMQRQKVAALELASKVDAVVYCWDHSPKPAAEGFQQAMALLGVTADEVMVVGDRPDHDLAAAAALACPSIRLRRGRFAQQTSAPYQPLTEMVDLLSLPGVLRDLS